MAQTTPFSVRIDVDVKEALDRAAAADRRSTASMVNKMLADWLAHHGFLGAPASLGTERASPLQPRYQRLPGRPRKAPDATPSLVWLDDKLSKILEERERLTLDDACLAVLDLSLDEVVSGSPQAQRPAQPHFAKFLANALLRAGWVEAHDNETSENVWVPQGSIFAAKASR